MTASSTAGPNRSGLAKIGAETLEILESGSYIHSDQIVSIDAELASAVAAARTYTPEELTALSEKDFAPLSSGRKTSVCVTEEGSIEACRRLVVDEGETQVVCLNFASAKNPGGGFLSGARAQEESLCRCSALYATLTGQTRYYTTNRQDRHKALYTGHLIWSPDVPVFRNDRSLELLPKPYPVSFLTIPAPNRGAIAKRKNLQQHAEQLIADALRERVTALLSTAAEHDGRCLVLGAWGCGCFRNQPDAVARVFAAALTDDGAPFADRFERVVFAIRDDSKERKCLAAFRTAFPEEPQGNPV